VAATSGEQLIVGIADAASYLGYDKPESFRRARTRNPIPGEGKTDDGRPCWTPAALRSWQSKRKIAGHRIHDEEALLSVVLAAPEDWRTAGLVRLTDQRSARSTCAPRERGARHH
jgi:hypothetical protein